MFTSMTATVSTNTYCLARTRRFSRRYENSVGRVTQEREAPTNTVQLVLIIILQRKLGVFNAGFHEVSYLKSDGALRDKGEA